MRWRQVARSSAPSTSDRKIRKMMKKINKVKDSEGNNVDLTSKLFNEIAPKYAGKNVGGYTRIVKAGPRRGDGAEVAILQLI